MDYKYTIIKKVYRKVNRLALKVLFRFISIKTIKDMLFWKFEQERFFKYNDVTLEYFFHSYNNFRLTERCIEIPIIKHYLKSKNYKRILEIGNVTKHYYSLFQKFDLKETIDKYEKAYDVLNIDIKDYKPSHKYDFIYSISTFEHMDSDAGRNPEYKAKIDKSKFTSYGFENINYVLNNMLDKNGKFIVTFLMNYGNKEIDQSLINNEYINFRAKKVDVIFFERVDEIKWKQLNSFEDCISRLNVGNKVLCIIEIDK